MATCDEKGWIAMREFFVWCPMDGDKPTKPNIKSARDSVDPEWAALEWVESNWADLDYASSIDVYVIVKKSGRRFNYNVTVEMSPTFNAKRMGKS